MQDAAKKYFDGAYGFYLHYATHHGDEIDGPVCLRALVVASDLLFLVGASRLSFERVGGVKGLVERGVFPSRDAILALLSFLDGPDHGGYCLPNEICDGYYEDLGKMDLEAKHLQAVIDVGLIEYWVDRNVSDPDGLTESVGIFHLTRLGESVLKSGSS